MKATKSSPQNGDIIAIQGYEFLVSDVRIVKSENTPSVGKCCRFTGICTDNKANDSIRHTGYNGGTYGWRVE